MRSEEFKKNNFNKAANNKLEKIETTKEEKIISSIQESPVETFPIDEMSRRILENYFEKKGFSIIEISNTHIKLKTPTGGELKISNKTALEIISLRG